MTERQMVEALDTGALNKYLFDYVEFAMDKAEIPDDVQISILHALRYTLDTYTADEIHELMG